MAKVIGSTLEYSGERIAALMLEYEKYIASCSHIRMSEVFEHIVNQPCSRFWVSEVRAAVVVAAMLRGDSLAGMHPAKKEMFSEIFRRFLLMRSDFPERSLSRLVSHIITQPAPKFYLSPSSAKIMFYKAKKEWYARKMLNLRRC